MSFLLILLPTVAAFAACFLSTFIAADYLFP